MLPSLLFILLSCSFPSDAGRPKKEIFNGVSLRAPGVNFPPFVYPVKDRGSGNVTYVGHMMQPINWISTRYNMKFEFVEIDESVSNKDLFVYARLLPMVANKVFDFMPIPFVVDWELTSRLAFTYPTSFEEYRLLQKYPDEESRLMAILKPFSLTVWLWSIGIIAIFVVVLTTLTIFNPEWIQGGPKMSAWGHLNHHFEYVTAIIAYQGYYVSYTAGRSFFILCGCWALMMRVLTYAYTGNLTSCLVTPTFYPIANSLEDVVTMNKKVTVATASRLVENFLNTTSSGPGKVIGDYLRKHPNMISSSLDQVMTNVIQDDCVYIGQHTILRILIGNDLERNKRCTFTYSALIPFYSEQYSFSMPKDNPYLVFISDSQMVLWETGMMQHWFAVHYRSIDACSVQKNPPRSNNVPLNLIDLSSAFLLLTFGIGLSFVVFLVEHVISAGHSARRGIKLV